MPPFTLIFLAALVASTAYAIGRKHAEGGYKRGFRHGYEDGCARGINLARGVQKALGMGERPMIVRQGDGAHDRAVARPSVGAGTGGGGAHRAP